ncbi:MAG: class A beta-lactamase-related serine hydrolase [Flavobacteriales bacterium]|nr:class A beta-lactamase-related serine hydrolase [Flavobacteriales bacterium]
MRLILFLVFTGLFLITGAQQREEASDNSAFWTTIKKSMPQYKKVFRKHKDYRLELIVTRIDRDQTNHPVKLTRYHYGDSSTYFYPASTVKLPVAIFTMEKIWSLYKGATTESLIEFSPVKFCNDHVYENNYHLYQRLTESETLRQLADRLHIPVQFLKSVNPGLPVDTLIAANSSIRISAQKSPLSFRDLLSSMLVYSDNESFNKLFDVVGIDYINQRLQECNFSSSRIVRRLMYCPDTSRFIGPDFRILTSDSSSVLLKERSRGRVMAENLELKGTVVGKKHMEGEAVLKGGRDFSNHNFVSLSDLHEMMIRLVFHDMLPKNEQFRMGKFEQRFLLRLLGNHPREITRMRTNQYDYLEDGYTNFLLNGDSKDPIPNRYRIINIAGWANGFTTDVAYVMDMQSNTEFFISARIYTNKNKVIGDDTYEYSTIARPFMQAFGQSVLDIERNRSKEFLPNLIVIGGIFK